jgi:hypothetical protein
MVCKFGVPPVEFWLIPSIFLNLGSDKDSLGEEKTGV